MFLVCSEVPESKTNFYLCSPHVPIVQPRHIYYGCNPLPQVGKFYQERLFLSAVIPPFRTEWWTKVIMIGCTPPPFQTISRSAYIIVTSWNYLDHQYLQWNTIQPAAKTPPPPPLLPNSLFQEQQCPLRTMSFYFPPKCHISLTLQRAVTLVFSDYSLQWLFEFIKQKMKMQIFDWINTIKQVCPSKSFRTVNGGGGSGGAVMTGGGGAVSQGIYHCNKGATYSTAVFWCSKLF